MLSTHFEYLIYVVLFIYSITAGGLRLENCSRIIFMSSLFSTFSHFCVQIKVLWLKKKQPPTETAWRQDDPIKKCLVFEQHRRPFKSGPEER